MAIDDNTSYELTGAQVKDLANKIKAKAADNIFVGATSAIPGSKGLVPAPQAGDDTKFLKGDGTWATAGGSSATIVYVELNNGWSSIRAFSDAGKTVAMSVNDIYNATKAGVVVFKYDDNNTDTDYVIISSRKRTSSSSFMYSFTAYGTRSTSYDTGSYTELTTGWGDGTTNVMSVNTHYLQEELTAGTGITISGTTISSSAGGKYYTTEYDPTNNFYTLWSPDVSQDPSEFFELFDVDAQSFVYGDDLFEATLTSVVTITGTDSIYSAPDDYDSNATAAVISVEKVNDNGTTGYLAWVLVRPLDSQGDPMGERLRRIYCEEYSSAWHIEADFPLGGGGTTYTAGNHINITNDVISAIDYIHADTPTPATTPTGTITSGMIADGTITAADIATGVVPTITLSTTDIGEGAPLAANTLYGVYE